MKKFFRFSLTGLGVILGVCIQAETLLNVSYDVSRELYKDINSAFIQKYAAETGKKIIIDQSHNGSSKQARAIIDGLEADVITMNQESDITLVQKAGLIDANWRDAFPNKSIPYSSTTLFLVRKGNPKGIHDWQDIVREGVQVIIPNHKTSGNGRYSYLAALAFAKNHFKDAPDPEAATRDFIKKIYLNAPILDAGSRGSTTNFIQRGMGDVLLTLESEVLEVTQQFNKNDFEIVVPSISIQADCPVAIVSTVAKKHHTEELATAYLNFLYSEKGKEIIAAHYLRPYSADTQGGGISANNPLFANVPMVTVEALGGWDYVNKTHFAEGGLFDQIYTKR